jgi:uncharacterized protein YcnI
MSTRTFARPLAGLAVGAALVVGVPLAASAHVTIDPIEAGPGYSTDVTLRAPNESATASTVKIEVHLPADTPFTNLRYEPTPGWTTTVTTGTLPTPVEVSGNTITEAPTSVVFTAEPGHAIAPGQFETWKLALGPVPEVGHIVLPVTQTYSDGTVVEWNATPEEVAGDDTLEPAPVLYVEDTPKDGHHQADAAAATGAQPASSDGLAVGLSIGSLVLAAGAVLLAAFAFGRRRKADA